MTTYRPVSPPFAWYGGKQMLAQWIVAQFPPHTRYIEPFGGSGAVLMAKPPCAWELFNDLDDGVVGFYRVVQDPDLAPRLQQTAALTPWSRRLYHQWLRTWPDHPDPVVRAARWWYVQRAAFSGGGQKSTPNSWSINGQTTGDLPAKVATWIHTWENLPAVHQRWLRVLIEHRDARDLMDRWDAPDVLWYLDPPYDPTQRNPRHRYHHDVTATTHTEWADRFQELRGMVVLSGYPGSYPQLEQAGWQRIDRAVVSAAVYRRDTPRTADQRVESLWLNPAAQAARREATQLTWI